MEIPGEHTWRQVRHPGDEEIKSYITCPTTPALRKHLQIDLLGCLSLLKSRLDGGIRRCRSVTK